MSGKVQQVLLIFTNLSHLDTRIENIFIKASLENMSGLLVLSSNLTKVTNRGE